MLFRSFQKKPVRLSPDFPYVMHTIQLVGGSNTLQAFFEKIVSFILNSFLLLDMPQVLPSTCNITPPLVRRQASGNIIFYSIASFSANSGVAVSPSIIYGNIGPCGFQPPETFPASSSFRGFISSAKSSGVI